MNGVAERINQTLLDLIRSMLTTASVPQRFRTKVLSTTCYIKNRVGHSTIQDGVPDNIWTGITPSVKNLKAFGCLAYAHVDK